MMNESNLVIDEIRRLHDERQTGVLLLESSRGERVQIVFCEGMVEAASSSHGAQRLGDYLVKDGHVSAKDLDSLQAGTKRDRTPIGEAIVRRKLASHAEVGAAVRRQSLDLLQSALTGDFKVASFTNSLRSYYVPARISFSHILLELSRTAPKSFDLGMSTFLALNSDLDMSAFPWFPQELSVLNELQSAQSLGDLMRATGLKEQGLRRVLGTLERLGAIRTVAAPDAPAENGALARKSEFMMERLIPQVTNAVLDEKLEVARNGFSFTSEQFRNLKIQLKQAESKTPLKVLTISSPDAQDGKSLVSSNLAFSFAQDTGCKTLIIDCDLRKPSLDKYLGVPTDPGLLQYLSGGPLNPRCFVRKLDNLYFMTAGGIAPNAIEVLSMRRMKELVEYFRSMFDTIILDAPPYSPIADARVVTALSDGLIMVIRSGKTAYSSTDRAFRAVDHAKLVGVVLNDVKPVPFQTYHNYSYYQYGDTHPVYAGNGKSRSAPKKYLE